MCHQLLENDRVRDEEEARGEEHLEERVPAFELKQVGS